MHLPITFVVLSLLVARSSGAAPTAALDGRCLAAEEVADGSYGTPGDVQVAVVDGCLGTFSLPVSASGKRCDESVSPGGVSWSCTGPQRCPVSADTHVAVAGPRRLAVRVRQKFCNAPAQFGSRELAWRAPIERVPSGSVPAAIASAEPLVAAALLESAARDPAQRTIAIRTVLAREWSTAEASALATRAIELAADPALVPELERAGADARLAPAAADALEKLLPDAAARDASILRIVARGGDGARTLAMALASRAPPAPDSVAKLLPHLRSSTPGSRGAAIEAVRVALPKDRFAQAALEQATLAPCPERLALLAEPGLVGAIVAAVEPGRVFAALEPLLADPSCPESRDQSWYLVAERLSKRGEGPAEAWTKLLAHVRSAPRSRSASYVKQSFRQYRCTYPAKAGEPAAIRELLKEIDEVKCRR